VNETIINILIDRLSKENDFNNCLNLLLENEDNQQSKINIDASKKIIKGTYNDKFNQFKQENGIPLESKIFALDKHLFGTLYEELTSRGWSHVSFDDLLPYG
jgi:hypothetical protein